MKLDILKLASASVFALSVAAAPAVAQNAMDWDENEDRMIDQEEFSKGFGDADKVYDRWDGDASGMLDEEEFDTGMGEMERDEDFAEWDADESGDLSREEYEEGVFGMFDEDESGDWDESEFTEYGENREAFEGRE